jgi:TatD DNase family protein
MLFDTHAHYDDESYNEDREEVLRKSYESGVSYILNASCDIVTTIQSIELSKKFEFVYASVGFHPHSVSKASEKDLETLMKLGKKDKVVAVGEIGLDYYYEFSPRELQKKWFRLQIDIAKNLNLPIIVHNREAHADSLNIVKEENAKEVGGVFHCYSGSKEMARELLNNNFYISIAGPVTFKNASKVVEVAKYIPDDRLLIETDCPYLTPEPYRGKRNQSTYVRFVAEKIAEIRGTSFEYIAETTKENGKRLFGIK